MAAEYEAKIKQLKTLSKAQTSFLKVKSLSHSFSLFIRFNKKYIHTQTQHTHKGASAREAQRRGNARLKRNRGAKLAL